ncbi:methylmalonyl Co-A mutase-associated GTPase MeaB [bacterium]|nr:methylmalonyl Co-A mutase-associated GTPase MeaB [bacterium]
MKDHKARLDEAAIKGDESTDNRVNQLANQVIEGSRSALAQAITLLESSRASDVDLKSALLERFQRKSGSAIRLAVTGAPGVGKSSLIELLGLSLVKRGQKIAVLAIDPSSSRSGGSILGDKTRMTHLSKSAGAFIRPSPTSGVLGGVADSTRETIMACEAAGYDWVLVETVGVGQSETTVASLTDIVLFTTIAGSGDSLQGIKRGILEWVDVVAVNKSDGNNIAASASFATELSAALHLLHGSDTPPSVLQTSALSDVGIDELLTSIDAIISDRRRTGAWDIRRNKQLAQWFDHAVSNSILKQIKQNESLSSLKEKLKNDVALGNVHPFAAAQMFVRQLLPKDEN